MGQLIRNISSILPRLRIEHSAKGCETFRNSIPSLAVACVTLFCGLLTSYSYCNDQGDHRRNDPSERILTIDEVFSDAASVSVFGPTSSGFPPSIVSRHLIFDVRDGTKFRTAGWTFVDDSGSIGSQNIRLIAEIDESDRSLNDLAPPISADGAESSKPSKSSSRSKALFNLDVDKLGEVNVKQSAPMTNNDVPSSVLNANSTRNRNAGTTGELLENAASVNVRRTSAINLDALVRGYNSQQTVAVANGMNELKTRIDIDSLFSQIDPGIVRNITVIDGPYSSLYGPGFAFLVADLNQGQRYSDHFQGHASSLITYGSNGGTLYTRETATGGGSDYSAYVSYGLRNGNDYRTGGDGEKIPSSYSKQDAFVAFSRDINSDSRLDFNYLRTEINNLLLPGVVYDINNSTNNQFNAKYVVQEDKDGPEQFVLQGWYQNTGYNGDATRESKQSSFYRVFVTPTAFSDMPINTIASGQSTTMGSRTFVTFGDADHPQLTVGGDLRRSVTQYSESDLTSTGSLIFSGNLYGIPSSSQNDAGIFTSVLMPVSDATSVSFGSRLDYVWSQVDPNDAVITTTSNPAANFYIPGTNSNANVLGMAYLTQRTQLSEEWSWNSGAAFAMRNATTTELYSDEPYVPFARFGNSYIDGNSTLAPEQNFQLDIGARYMNGPSTFSLRGYNALIHDYIMPVATQTNGANPGSERFGFGRDFSSFPTRTDVSLGTTNADNTSAGYRYGNIPWVGLWGLDCSGEYRAMPWLSLSASATYVNGTNYSPTAFVLDTTSTGHFIRLGGTDGLPNIYPLNGTLRVRLMEPVTDRWNCDLVARLVGSQDRVAKTVAELPTAGFAVFSIRSSYRPREWWRITASIENLLNQSFTQHGSLVIIGSNGSPTFVREPGIGVFLGNEFTF